MYPKSRKLKPIQWVGIFIAFTLCLVWMLLDTSSGIQYRHSVRHAEPAARVLNLDDAYRKEVQRLSTHLQSFCDRGADVVFAHNVLVNDKIWNDYVFHECGGSTWLNAKISVKTESQVKCQEEYAGVFRSVPRAKIISMKAVDVGAWTEREITAEGKTACIMQHAVDILDANWVGM